MQDVQQSRIIYTPPLLNTKLTVSGPQVRGGGFHVQGFVLEEDSWKPLGFQRAWPVGKLITRQFELPEEAFMDCIQIAEQYRGRGLARLFVDTTARKFSEIGGVHLLAMTTNGLGLERMYREKGYIDPVCTGRRAGTDDVAMIQKWLYKSY